MEKDLTESQLLQALQDAVSEQSVEGLRTQDIKDLLGWSFPKIRGVLRKLVEVGKVQVIHTIEANYTGRKSAFIRYQLAQSAEETVDSD